MFNIPFHEINRDGRLRAHVARLCAVARRKLVSTEVRSKLQGDTKTTRYAKTTATAPTYIGTVSAPSPIPAQSPLLADASLESAALLRVSSSRCGFIACSCILPDSPSMSHTQVAYSRCLVCG